MSVPQADGEAPGDDQAGTDGRSSETGGARGGLPGGVFTGPTQRRLLSNPSRARRRRRPTAFVFAGGGSRGAAQVGMLQALVARGIRPDAVYGSSVGAINSAGFAGDPTNDGVARIAEIWRDLTRDDIFPTGRLPGPWRFLQQREAVHSNDGLRRVIERGLRFDRLENAAIHLEVVATSLTDGRPRWFSNGPAVDALLASSALPALLPPVTIGDQTFIDGGVADNVPIGRAISGGAERVFVLLCGPLHYTPHRYRRPVEAVLTSFFIAIHARFAHELERLPKGVEVVVFTVDTEPLSRYDDFSQTETLMAAGRANAERVLEFWAGGGVGDESVVPTRPAINDVLVPPAEELV